MRRFVKVLGILVILLVLCAAALVIAVRFLPESDLIRNSLKNRLSDLTGQNVTLGSLNVSLSFPSLIDLSVKGVSVTSKDGKPLLSVERVDLSPTLTSILERQVAIKSVTVRGLRAFVRKPRGRKVEDVLKPPVSEPVPTQESKEPAEPPSREARGTHPPSPQTRPTRKDVDRLTWSIDAVRIRDARIDWIDQDVVPGREVRVSLKGIDGSLKMKEAANSFAVQLAGDLAGENGREARIAIGGTLKATEDLSGLSAANLHLSAKSVDLKTFREYVPPSARLVEEFDLADLSAQLEWLKGGPARIPLKASMKADGKDAAQINLQGDILVTKGFSEIGEIRCTVESDMLPLRFLAPYVPSDFPLDPAHGTVKASIRGQWNCQGSWELDGSVGVEDGVPVARFSKIAKKVRVWLEAKLNSRSLDLRNLEIVGPERLASIDGKISNPLSDARELDLKGDIIVKPAWLREFGVTLPKELTIQGTVPVRGRARGRPEDLWVDLTADMTSAHVGWVSHLDKAPGSKATVSLKGKFLSGKVSSRKTVPEAVVTVGISKATLRVIPEGPRLSNCAVHFDSQVVLNANGPDLKDANLAIRRGTGTKTIFSARAYIKDLGSGSSAIHANAGAVLDKTTLALVGLEQRPGVRISGSAPLKAAIKGSQSALDWSVHVPLTHLDIAVEDAFRKPGGMTGTLRATGTWALKELVVRYGKLTLPGVVVTCKGNLRDNDGRFRGLTLITKNTRLEDLSRLVPPLQGKGLAGPLDATVHLRPAGNKVDAAGKIRLVEAAYAPKNAGWSVEKVRGVLEIDGTLMHIPELRGRLKGAVQGPVEIKGKLGNIESVEKMNGHLSVHMGKGRINAGALRNILTQANILLGTLVNPGKKGTGANALDIDSVTGTCRIHSGVLRTEDLKLQGPDLHVGAMGSFKLKSTSLDALVGMKTYTIVPAVLGKIPAVKKLVKQHQGLLKALGIDKELKRLGIGGSDKGEQKPDQTAITKTPVTVIVKVGGPASNPTVTPVLEATLNKNIAARLRALMN